MHKRAASAAILLAVSAFGQEIHLKTRTIATQGRALTGRVRRAPTDDNQGVLRHLIVQFDHAPGVGDLESLAAEGTLVGALPDNAVVLTARTRTLASRGDIQWVSGFEPSDKLSPEFSQTSDDLVAAVVEFHGDVNPDQQEALLTRLGLQWQRPALLLSNHVLIRETVSTMRALAEADEVAYVFPADPDLSAAESNLNACAGMLTASGPVAQYANIVHGWDLDPDRTAHLSYVFGSLTSKVPATTVQSEIIRAMNEWSKNTRVTFQAGTVASAARTLLIQFASGSHGDAYPFDGAGKTLAHTFYPVPVNAESLAGDLHLDADENWRAGGDLDIYTVALHELGHAIGLGHSDNPGDVMYPYYRRGVPLSANDIGAARSLYGTPSETVSAAPVNVSSVMPFQISVNAAPDPGSQGQISVTGTVSGGEGPWSVQWQSDKAYTGKATLSSTGAWTASGISLVTGANAITFTAFDAAHRTASQTVVVNKSAVAAGPSAASGPISLKVSSPVGSVISVNQAALTVSGTSSSGEGIVRVNWQTAAGASGTAVGSERWIASNIPLLTGTNTIILRAYDAKGGSAWASLVVVRR